VAVYLDAAAGQGGEGVIAVRAGQRGGEAGGSRAGPGGGDDGAAGGGERDLAGVDGLAGAGSLAGGDGDRGRGAGRGAGQFHGDDPGGVLLGDQGRGSGAEHRAGGRPGAADRRLRFLQRCLGPDPPPVIGGGEDLSRVGGVIMEVGDQAEQLGGVRPATVIVYSMTRTVSVVPPPDSSARWEPSGRNPPARRSGMSLLTRIRACVPVASIRAMRGTPGKLRSSSQIRRSVNRLGYSSSALSSRTCSASPFSRPPPAAAPDGPEVTARVARVDALLN